MTPQSDLEEALQAEEKYFNAECPFDFDSDFKSDFGPGFMTGCEHIRNVELKEAKAEIERLKVELKSARFLVENRIPRLNVLLEDARTDIKDATTLLREMHDCLEDCVATLAEEAPACKMVQTEKALNKFKASKWGSE